MKESQHLEWKESWRDEALKTICGFANAEGGTLVVGRDDKGKVVGISNARRLLEEIPNKARDLMGVMVNVRLRTQQKLEYLEIKIDPYPNLISYRGECYYRSGSTTQVLRGAALTEFQLRKQGKHWDGVPLTGIAVKDLSKPAIDLFRKLAKGSGRLDAAIIKESSLGLIEKLHLVENKNLKRAAVLMFHPDPEKYISGAFLKIGFFNSNTDLLYHDEIHGGLFTQVEKAMELLLTKYLKAGITYKGIQRVETYPVPEAALREAVLNAIIHKDYASGTPIQISVYPDKIMLWNSGNLPRDWTVAKLKGKHPSQPFNPDIANAFFRAGMIEAWGRGIERMITACRESGMKEPDIRHDHAGLWVEFAYPETWGVTTRETTPITTPITTPKQLVVLLRENPTISQKDLASALKLTRDGIKYHLNKLKKEGVIRHTGPSRGGRWEVIK